MSSEKKQTTVCPLCQAQYQVPIMFQGRRVNCKACGEKFTINFGDQAAALPSPEEQKNLAKFIKTRSLDRQFGKIVIGSKWTTQEDVEAALNEQSKIFRDTRSIAPIGDLLVQAGALTPEQRENVLAKQQRLGQGPVPARTQVEAGDQAFLSTGFHIDVSPDRLQAFLFKDEGDSNRITMAELKKMLALKGIIHGLAPEKIMADYINTPQAWRRALKLAQGTPPGRPLDQRVKYYFKTDPLKLNKLKKGETIDYRNRGQIPQVKEGDLIAEIVEGMPGNPGMDVFGHSLPGLQPNKIKVICGGGVSKSENGMRMYASRDGRPEVSADGKLYVFPDLKIDGNVDFQVGHIDFDGAIEVSGIVEDGFRVKGGSLMAQEIQKAEVEVEGDVTVYGGVIGATIKAGGSIRARYLHGATIEAMGDVVSEKEIRQSTVETSGVCISERGNILDSIIYAKKGVQTRDLGSEKAAPSKIVVGIDIRVKKKIDELKEQVTSRNDLIKRLREEMEKQHKKVDSFNYRLDELNEAWSMADKQLKDATTLLTKIQEKGDRTQLDKLERTIEHLNNTKNETQQNIEGILDKQDEILKAVSDREKEVIECEEEMDQLNLEIDNLMIWTQREANNPEVKILGSAIPGATVRGIYSSLVIKDAVNYVIIKEVKVHPSTDKSDWQMRIEPMA